MAADHRAGGGEHELIRAAPADRRGLSMALHPGHAGHASRYEAAMRARTRLLTADTPADPGWRLVDMPGQPTAGGRALFARAVIERR